MQSLRLAALQLAAEDVGIVDAQVTSASARVGAETARQATRVETRRNDQDIGPPESGLKRGSGFMDTLYGLPSAHSQTWRMDNDIIRMCLRVRWCSKAHVPTPEESQAGPALFVLTTPDVRNEGTGERMNADYLQPNTEEGTLGPSSARSISLLAGSP
jgi:hypothetical protein